MVDIDKMKRGYTREQRSGEYLQLAPGETLLYIHPQCRADDKYEPTEGINYIPVVVHYGVGKGAVTDKGAKGGGKSRGSTVASLDAEINPIIEHPFIKRYLKKAKKKIVGKCPVGKLISSGDLDDDELNEMRAQTRYVWGVTPLAHRNASSEDWKNLTPKPSVLMSGKTVYDGIMEVFFDNGDITDPTAAILVIIKREGKDMTTKYYVRADTDSLKKPKKLSSELRAQLAKVLKEDGDCDLFKVVSGMIKSTAEVEALIAGVKVESEPDDDDDEDEEETTSKPSKDDDDEDEDEDDGEAELDEDEDEDEDEEPEPPPPPSKKDKKGAAVAKPDKASKKPSKPAPEPEPEDDDEEDEDEDDDDDDGDAIPAPPPPSKKDKKSKKAPEPEPEEDDEDEDEDEDDEDEEDEESPPPPPTSKKDKKSKEAKADKKPSKKDEDEESDEELDLDEIEKELEELATSGKSDKGESKKDKKSKK